jgi:hypothetical protein
MAKRLITYLDVEKLILKYHMTMKREKVEEMIDYNIVLGIDHAHPAIKKLLNKVYNKKEILEEIEKL